MWDNNCNSLISEAKVQIYKVRMGDDGDFDIDAMLEAPYEKEVNLWESFEDHDDPHLHNTS